MLGYSTLSQLNLSCDPGDICEKNSDCGRDKWNRKGKCVITKRPNRYGNFEFGGIKMSGSHYKKKHGNWRKHKYVNNHAILDERDMTFLAFPIRICSIVLTFGTIHLRHQHVL